MDVPFLNLLGISRIIAGCRVDGCLYRVKVPFDVIVDGSFSHEAVDALVKYSFPGNIRELEHLILRVITLARSATISPGDTYVWARLPARVIWAHGWMMWNGK